LAATRLRLRKYKTMAEMFEHFDDSNCAAGIESLSQASDKKGYGQVNTSMA